MIISKNWLNEFIDLTSVSTEQLCKTLNNIGLEVDSCVQIRMSEKVVVGRIVECEKHPDADKLNICKVDVGAQECLQIVCGAKNARVGVFTAVALEGAQVGEIYIKRAKLRGVESCGMCCSSTELGLPAIGDGIIELDESIGQIAPGNKLCDLAPFNDDVIEVELTPNRGDCLSLNGIARDLSAALDINLKQKETYKDDENAMGIRRLVTAHYADTLSGSFCMKAATDNNKFSSPLLMKLRLAIAGKLAKSGAQNHLMYATHATGVLMYGIDMDKLGAGAEQYALQVKPLANGESEISFDGRRVAIASVYCSDEFAADENTERLLIMAHYTHPDVIARCHKDYKNADVYHSFRGSEPELELGLNYLCAQLNAHVLAGTSTNAASSEAASVNFTMAMLDKLIGQQCEKNDVVRILKRLGFELNIVDDNIYVKVPQFRHDISNSADICEEIVRITGIDNIVARPLEFTEANRTNMVFNSYKFACKLRERAVMRGYFESIGYIFDSREFLEKLELPYYKNELLNPITAEMNVLRPMILCTLLKHVRSNLAHGSKGVKLFEIGEVFDSIDGRQKRHLCLAASGQSGVASLRNSAKPSAISLYDVLADAKSIIGNFTLQASANNLFSEYERADIYKNGCKIGEVGRLRLDLEDELDLAKTYIFEVDFSKVNNPSVTACEYSKLPGTSRDLSILVPINYDYSKICEHINTLNIKTLKGYKISNLYRDEHMLGKESLTISFEFSDHERQLKNDDVNAEMEQILEKLNQMGLQQR